MKFKAFFLLMLGTPLLSPAQSANEVIQNFKEFVQNTKQYTCQFTYTLNVPDEKVNLKEEGQSWVKDQWSKLELHSHTIYMDGQTRWTYTPATEEVVITKAGTQPEDVLSNPNLLIMRYLKNTSARFATDSKAVAESSNYHLVLTPAGKQSPFKQIQLVLNKQNLFPVRMQYLGKDGSQMLVNFNKFNLITGPFSIHEVRFNPQKYKDAEIIDMR